MFEFDVVIQHIEVLPISWFAKHRTAVNLKIWNTNSNVACFSSHHIDRWHTNMVFYVAVQLTAIDSATMLGFDFWRYCKAINKPLITSTFKRLSPRNSNGLRCIDSPVGKKINFKYYLFILSWSIWKKSRVSILCLYVRLRPVKCIARPKAMLPNEHHKSSTTEY